MNTNVMFSSEREDWTTPQNLFNELNAEFHFTLDAAASPDNAKCERFFTAEQNALCQNWWGETVFCNPPYGRKTGDFVKKGYEESKKPGTTVVMLLPSRTDTRWFHDYILGKAEVRFLKGRLKFGNSKNSAPFGSLIAVWSYQK